MALLIAALSIVGVAGCWGPLDSPIPRPPVTRDAAVDVRRDAIADRGGVDGRRDAGSDVFDGARPDSGRPEVAPDAGNWPVVMGCVTGLPAVPYLDMASAEPSLTVGCGPAVLTYARLADRARRGLIFEASLDPPLAGFEVSYYPNLCSYDTDAPIMIDATGRAALAPGDQLFTTLRITVQGPTPFLLAALPVHITVLATHFALVTDVVDFGTVELGFTAMRDLTVINDTQSAPISYMFASPNEQAPFSLFGLTGDSGPLQPGMTGALMIAFLNPRAPGTFESVFTVSSSLPDAPTFPTCGTVTQVVMRAQVVPPSRPIP